MFYNLFKMNRLYYIIGKSLLAYYERAYIMKPVDQPFKETVYEVTIPFKGQDIKRYLRVPNNTTGVSWECGLYTVPVSESDVNKWLLGINNFFSDDDSAVTYDLLYKCGSYRRSNSDTDIFDFHNYRQFGTENEHQTSGLVADKLHEIIKTHADYLFQSQCSFAIKSDYTKKATSIFSSELNKMLAYANKHQMKVYSRKSDTMYSGTRNTYKTGSIVEFILKTRSRKEILLAKITKTNAFRNNKGSLIIQFPKNPIKYMEAGYNEQIQNYVYDEFTMFHYFNDNLGWTSSHEIKSYSKLQVTKDMMIEFYSQARIKAAPEKHYNHPSFVWSSFYKGFPQNDDELNAFVEKNLKTEKVNSFKPALWQAKELVSAWDNLQHEYLSKNEYAVPILKSNPDSLAYIEEAVKYFPDSPEYEDYRDAITKLNPDKDIAKVLLGKGIAPLKVADIIHQNSPWSVYKEGLFADRTKCAALVKEAMTEVSTAGHTKKSYSK